MQEKQSSKGRNSPLRRILILEDDKDTLKMLIKMIEDLEEKADIFALRRADKAYICASKVTIDLFIVDVTWEGENEEFPPELEFVDKIRNMQKYVITPILFITELRGTKLYTYEKLNCYKFIDKPVKEELFEKIVEDSLRSISRTYREKKVYFRKGGVIQGVNKSAIVYIKLEKRKLYIHLKDHRIICVPNMSVSQMKEKLDDTNFIRCQRGAIVNIDYVRSLDRGRRKIQLKRGFGELDTGITYDKTLWEILQEEW